MIGNNKLPKAVQPPGGTYTTPAELKNVADTFVSLQQARHEADYDLFFATFSQARGPRLCRTPPRPAFEAWRQVKKDVRRSSVPGFLATFGNAGMTTRAEVGAAQWLGGKITWLRGDRLGWLRGDRLCSWCPARPSVSGLLAFRHSRGASRPKSKTKVDTAAHLGPEASFWSGQQQGNKDMHRNPQHPAVEQHHKLWS